MASSSAIKAGRAFILIEAMDKTGMVLNRISKRFNKWGSQLAGSGRRMMMAATAALLPIAMATSTYAGFDDVMRSVEAKTGATADQMERLRTQAKELGRTTSFTSIQVGQLQNKLGMMGRNPEQIEAMTESVLALARAAGSGEEGDTQLASSLVGGLMDAFDITGAEGAEHVADVVTLAANRSNVSLETLANSFPYIGKLAKEAGMDLEETVGILGMLGTNLIDGSMAGTALTRILKNLANETKRAALQNRLKELTGKDIAVVDANNDMRNPIDVLNDIGEAMDGLGSADRLATMEAVFGRGMVAATALSKDRNRLKSFVGDMKGPGVHGEARRASTLMDAGLGGEGRRTASAFEGFKLAIGGSLDKTLSKLMELTQDVLIGTTEWIEKNEEVVVVVASVIAGVGLLGAGLVVLGAGLSAVGTLLGMAATVLVAVKSGIALLLTPIGLVVAAVVLIGGAVAAVVYTLYQHSDSFRGVLDKWVGWASDAWNAIASEGAVIWQWIASAASQAWHATIGPLVSWVSDKFVAIWDSAVEVFSGITETASTTFGGIATAIKNGKIQEAWDILVAGLSLTWLQFSDFAADTWGTISLVILEAFEQMFAGVAVVVLEAWRYYEMLKLAIESASTMDPAKRAAIKERAGKINEWFAKAEAEGYINAAEAVAKYSAELKTAVEEREKATAGQKARLNGLVTALDEVADAAEGVEAATGVDPSDRSKWSAEQLAAYIKGKNGQGAGAATAIPLPALPLLMGKQKGTMAALEAEAKNRQAGQKKLEDIAADQLDAQTDMVALLRRGPILRTA